MACVATVAGTIKIIDMKRGKIVTSLYLTGSTIFETDWSVNGIVACSENCSVYFIGYDGEQMKLVKVVDFQCAIRSVAWNRIKTDTVAAGTFSGEIYIINGQTF